MAVEAFDTGTGSYTLTVAVVEATPVSVGAVAPGEVEDEGNVDFFVFEAEEGELYQVDVALGTLDDSVAVLYDSDLTELASNDDYADTYASRLYWEAGYSGSHYVAVEGGRSDSSGTYTLGIAVAEDDHSSSFAGATPVTVGETTPGEIAYEGDVDFFVFEAEEGQLYQVDVALGTLDDSFAELYDSGELWLASNDDHGDTWGSRLYWEAEYSGSHYVAVEGGWSDSSGTYTLAIATAEDDHSSSFAGATPVTVGETTPGEIAYEGDVDFFVFEAEEGQLYQVDVVLGTLDDSVAVLYNFGEIELERNDNRGSTLASRLYWEAEYFGSHYVAVEGGWSAMGTYILRIATR